MQERFCSNSPPIIVRLVGFVKEHRIVLGCTLVILFFIEYTCGIFATSIHTAVSSTVVWYSPASPDAATVIPPTLEEEIAKLESENAEFGRRHVETLAATKNKLRKKNLNDETKDFFSDNNQKNNNSASIINTRDSTSSSPSTTTTTTTTNPPQTLENCPVPPPNLVGPLKVVMMTPRTTNEEKLQLKWENLNKFHSSSGGGGGGGGSSGDGASTDDGSGQKEFTDGGHYIPKTCRARQKLALVIPYRDRDQHLRIFLNHLLPVLKRQLLDFKIYVIEQYGHTERFNRGLLLNVGFIEAQKEYGGNYWQCVIFHDVDLLPENDRNLYMCDDRQPKHMSVAVDKFNYQLPYDAIMGGVEAFPAETFRNINGFSNLYWGWGGEDDDLAERIRKSQYGYHVVRDDAALARYKMIKHPHKANDEEPERFQLLRVTARNMQHDGLSTLKYRVVTVEKNVLFTRVVVNISMCDYRQRMSYFNGVTRLCD